MTILRMIGDLGISSRFSQMRVESESLEQICSKCIESNESCEICYIILKNIFRILILSRSQNVRSESRILFRELEIPGSKLTRKKVQIRDQKREMIRATSREQFIETISQRGAVEPSGFSFKDWRVIPANRIESNWKFLANRVTQTRVFTIDTITVEERPTGNDSRKTGRYERRK